jgi:uncharacterized delta-60 repeat protein
VQAITKTSGALLAVASLCLVAAGCVRAGYDAERTDGPEPMDLASEARDHAAEEQDGQVFPPGSLDPTFGGKGFVLLPVNPTQIDQAKAVGLDASGRIVVGGQLWTAATGNDLFVARYLPSGAMDTSFNNGQGFIQTGSDNNDVLDSMVIDGKGRIVVGGMRYAAGAENELTLARYTSAGTLDGSFGVAGVAILPYGPHDDRVTGVAVDAQHRVLFSGRTEKQSGGAHHILAGRVTEAGALDATFAQAGIAETAFTSTSSSAWAGRLDSAGRLVVVGWVWSSAAQANDVAVARFAVDGALDTSFGTGGESQTNVASGDDHGWNLAIDAGDNIFVVGRASTTTTGRMLVLKLRDDGVPDSTFGTQGVYLLDPALDATGRSISLDASGRVVAVGDATGTGDLDVVVLRLQSDGSPDLTLGGTGHVLIDLGRDEKVRGSTLDGAGRLLVTGWQDEDATSDSYLLRVWL